MKNVTNFKSVAILAIMLLCATPLFSQGGRGGSQGNRQRPENGQRPERSGRSMTEDDVKARVDKLGESLDLNKDQIAKLKDYEVKAFKQGQIDRQKMEGDREAMRSYMMEQRKLRDAEYKEVLTEEQYKKYQEQMELRRQNYQKQRPEGQNPQGSDRPSRGRGR